MVYRPKENIVEHYQLSGLSKDILRTLLYFDIFKYPLPIKEIQMNSSFLNVKQEDIEGELAVLLEMKLIKTDGEFYYLSKEKEDIIERRKNGNVKAKQYLEIAHQVSRFMSYFPFVKGIFLSGSVSKGYADKDSDIDYFIVTEPGRLWLSRTLLILFKKIFLFNSRKYFCLNYFIDSDHLEIPDKNLFTAKEINYLIPVFNEDMYVRLKQHNLWAASYFPNFNPVYPHIIKEKKVIVKQVLETIFSGKPGDLLDTWCMQITEKFWTSKFRRKNYGSKASIRCKKHVSKFHPHDFEYKTLNFYQTRIKVYEEHYKVNLY